MTSMNRRNVLKGFAACSTLGSTAALWPNMALAGDAVAIQLSWIPAVEFAGESLALHQGFYSDEGLDMDLRPGGPDVDPTSLTVAKQVLIGLNDVMYAALAFGNGAPIKVIATTYQKNPTAIASLAAAPILTPQDMVGKRIGVQSGAESAIEAMLLLNAVDPASVTMVPVGYDPAPLAAGEVDGFLSFITNQPVALKVQGIETATMLLADYGVSQATDVFMVHVDTLNDPAERARLVRTMRATVRGWQMATEDLQAGVDAVMADYGVEFELDAAAQLLSAEAQVPLIATEETTANGLLTFSEEMIAANIATLAQLGVTATRDLFDTELMKEVFNGASRL